LETKQDSDLNLALHGLLINRLYHEDQLFVQRTSNFITINAFLIAAFALSFNVNEIKYFPYIIAGFGLLFALVQVPVGWRLEGTSNFWREYLWLSEKQIGINFDHALFDFYEKGEAKTTFGLICHVKKQKKPIYKTFPWNMPFVRSMNILLGISIPWVIAILWLLFIIILLFHQGFYWFPLLLIVSFFLLFSASWKWGRSPKIKRLDN